MAALVDKEDVKAQLNITGTADDAYIEGQISVYVAQLERRTNRKFGETLSFTEKSTQTGGQKRLVVTKYAPISSINEIRIDGDVVDAEDYEIEYGEVGFIRFKDGAWPHTSWSAGRSIIPYDYQAEFLYEIDYAGGQPLQADVKQAIIDSVVAAYSRRGMDPTIKSIKVGDASTSFGSAQTSSFAQVVSLYRVAKVI